MEFPFEMTEEEIRAEEQKAEATTPKALKQTKNFSDEIIIDILNSILESDFKIKNSALYLGVKRAAFFYLERVPIFLRISSLSHWIPRLTRLKPSP